MANASLSRRLRPSLEEFVAICRSGKGYHVTLALLRPRAGLAQTGRHSQRIRAFQTHISFTLRIRASGQGVAPLQAGRMSTKVLAVGQDALKYALSNMFNIVHRMTVLR